MAWIQSHHLHLQWKSKLWAGKFAWGVKAKHCWALSTYFLFSKVCWHYPACFASLPQVKFPAFNLNFHWRWRWWDWIQATILNLFCFKNEEWKFNNPKIVLTRMTLVLEYQFSSEMSTDNNEKCFSILFQKKTVILRWNGLQGFLLN